MSWPHLNSSGIPCSLAGLFVLVFLSLFCYQALSDFYPSLHLSTFHSTPLNPLPLPCLVPSHHHHRVKSPHITYLNQVPIFQCFQLSTISHTTPCPLHSVSHLLHHPPSTLPFLSLSYFTSSSACRRHRDEAFVIYCIDSLPANMPDLVPGPQWGIVVAVWGGKSDLGDCPGREVEVERKR